MLIIVIKRLLQIFKASGPEHPGITDGIILVKYIFGKTIGKIQNDMAPVDFHHQASTVKDQRSVFFFGENA